jgi:hypothetical protein
VDIYSHLPLGDAHNDLYGLPSNPVFVYHTGPSWPLPTGPLVCYHAIAPMWHELGKRIYEFFDSAELKWTIIDPVSFAEEEKEPDI